MARLESVLSIGWRLRPSPTAVGGGSSRAAAAADDDDDDEVEELSETEFKRRTLRLVRTDVGVRTVGTRAAQLRRFLRLRFCRCFLHRLRLAAREVIRRKPLKSLEPSRAAVCVASSSVLLVATHLIFQRTEASTRRRSRSPRGQLSLSETRTPPPTFLAAVISPTIMPNILDHGRAKYARRCLRMLISPR